MNQKVYKWFEIEFGISKIRRKQRLREYMKP